MIVLIAVVLAATPAVAGESLVAEKPPAADATRVADPARPAEQPPAVASPADAAPAPADTADAKPAVPFAAIYEAPIFGRSSVATEPKVDESALRYYAAQKQHARVDAEIRRLKALYPTWKVPSNLYTAGSGNDEQPLWDLFGANKMEDLHAAIKEREQRELGWRPSADLLSKMARREASTALVALSDAKDWAHVVEAANRFPAVMTCATIDVDWRVAEAFAQLKQGRRAFEVYQAILSTCRSRDERLATVRKAIALLPAADVTALIGMGMTLPDGSGEFDAARLDLMRAKIGDALAEGGSNDVPAEGLKLMADATLRSGNGADAALLGWYYFHVKDWAAANTWFKVGLDGTAGDPKLAEGRALALRNLGRLDEAEKLAGAWKDRSPNLKALYFGLVVARLTAVPPTRIEPELVTEFTALVEADRNPDGAQALGWYGYNRQSWDVAATWFKNAIDWVGDKVADKLDPKTLAGYGLALQNLGRLDEAEAVAYAYKDRAPELRDLFVSVAVAELTRPDPAPAITPDHYARFAEVITEAKSATGAAALAWRHLRDHDDPSAIDWFKSAIEWSPDGKGDLKINEGYALALRGAARYGEAEEVAYAWSAKSPEMKAVYRGVVTVELTDATLSGRIPESRVARFAAMVDAERSSEAAQALGWYRLNDTGCGYAVGWFAKAIAWSPDGRGNAKTNEGYAQALHAVARDVEAESVAFAGADTSPDMMSFYIKVVVDALTRTFPAEAVDEARLERFASAVRAQRSVNGAQALAWHRYRDAGCGFGVPWFAMAIEWSPDRQGDAKTNEGFGSALRDVGRLADAEAVLYPWVGRVPLMRDIYIDVVVAELTRDDPPKPLPEDRLGAFMAVATPVKSALAAQALGWYRFARHENPDAVRWFKLAVDWWPPLPPGAEHKPDAPEGYRPLDARLALTPADYRPTPRAYSSLAEDRDRQAISYLQTFGGYARTWTGYALALRAAGRVSDAEDVAFEWRDHWPALHALFVDIAVETLTKPEGDLPAERLKHFSSAIETERSPAGAAALGWYNTNRKNWTEAVVWFKAALDWRAPDAPVDVKAVEGYASALRNAGRFDEALAVASEWKDRIPSLKTLYLDASLDALQAKDTALNEDRLNELIALIEADTSPRGAMALGWYYYNTKAYDKALPRFKTAITAVGEGAVDPKAVEGFALTLRALGRTEDALTFASAWSAKVPSLRDTLSDIAAEILTRNNGADTLSPDMLAKLGGLVHTAKSATDATAFGWFAFAHKDWPSAADWFRDALTWTPGGRGDPKIAEGYAASLRNLCRFRDAENVAAPWISDPAGGTVRTVFIDTVAERLARQKPFVPLSQAESERLAGAVLLANSANGAQALGWYSYNAKQYRAAVAWFEKALGWNATEGTVYGLAMALRKLNDADGVARTIAAYGGQFPRLNALRRPGATLTFEEARNLDLKGSDCGRPTAMREDPGPTAFYPTSFAPVPTVFALPASPTVAAAPASVMSPGDGPATAAPRLRLMADPLTASASESEALEPRPSPRRGAAARDRTPRDPAPESARPRTGATSAGTSGSAESALAAKDYSRCLEIAEAEERGGRVRGNDRQAKGWCLLGLERPQEAALAFRAAQAGGDGKNKADSAYGESLALLGAGDTDAATSVANGASLTAERRTALGLQALEQRAYQAYQAGRWADTIAVLNQRAAYAAETRGMLMLRGWSLYHMGDRDAARAVFTTVDRQTSDRDSQRALAAVGDSTLPKGR